MRGTLYIVAAPSGAGKSRLAERLGWPVLRLDDFYKDGTDPSLPQLPDGDGADWDSPLSWDAGAAVAASSSPGPVSPRPAWPSSAPSCCRRTGATTR